MSKCQKSKYFSKLIINVFKNNYSNCIYGKNFNVFFQTLATIQNQQHSKSVFLFLRFKNVFFSDKKCCIVLIIVSSQQKKDFLN